LSTALWLRAAKEDQKMTRGEKGGMPEAWTEIRENNSRGGSKSGWGPHVPPNWTISGELPFDLIVKRKAGKKKHRLERNKGDGNVERTTKRPLQQRDQSQNQSHVQSDIEHETKKKGE